MRAAISTAPPGPNGIMMVTGRSGYAAEAVRGRPDSSSNPEFHWSSKALAYMADSLLHVVYYFADKV